MTNKAVVSLTTGLEDAERVTVALLVAVGAAETGRPTLMFLTKEAVRLAVRGVAVGTACDGCPPIPDLLARYQAAGGRYPDPLSETEKRETFAHVLFHLAYTSRCEHAIDPGERMHQRARPTLRDQADELVKRIPDR